MASEQMVCVLFTDLVESTALSARLGPDAFEQLRKEHVKLLREAVAAAGGREVKSVGDGVMVAFASSVAAIRCAVAMQQALEQRNRRSQTPLDVRIGVSLGDARLDDGDYYGPSVVEAARLCQAAAGGQILVSEVVRLMAGTREDYAFRAAGEFELKGFPAPVSAAEVVWERLPHATSAVPLPGRIRGIQDTGYVGREFERQELQALWQRVCDGERSVLLVSGEPGIGKTRLATHFAHSAYEQGATVLYGRCQEDLGAPYHVWIEVLSHLVDHGPESILRDHVERHGGELVRLVPQLGVRIPSTPAPRKSDSETERYLLYGAIADLLDASATQDPLVLMLDDLHWADRESLSLLRHLAEGSPESALLVIGTYRDSDIGLEHPLSSVLASLRREPRVDRIALKGLDDTEVAALMAAAAGHDLDHAGLELAGELRRETNGNPFFAVEILRHLVEQETISQREDGRWIVSGRLRELGLPQSVREVVGHRVQRLGGDALQTLSAAAVIGRDFDLDLLARVAEQDPDQVLLLLEEGVAASLLRESMTVAGRFTFAHALIEHTLYDTIGRTRRARLHERVAAELEALGAGLRDERLGELAYHWGAAVQPSVVGKASYYAGRAGEQALASLAPVQARHWFERALELDEQSGDSDPERRTQLMIGLGEAQRQSGDPAFRQTLLEAARLAQSRGDLDRLAGAMLATSRGFTNSIGHTDQELVDMYRSTAAALPEQDPRRAHVLALLALELAHTVTLAERRVLADEALKIARRNSDPLLLAHVLTCHPLATADASTRDERLRHTAEHVRLCDEIGDPALRFHAYARRGMVLEAGDVATWDVCLERMAELVEIAPQPALRWVLLFSRSPRALLAGQIEDAEALAHQALAVGGASGEPDARAFFGSQIFGVRYEQGRLTELTDVLAEMRTANPNIPSFGPMLGLALCEAGRNDEAAELLAAVTAERFASVVHGSIWLSTLGRWAEIAARLSDRGAAEQLYGQMAPYADHFLWNLVGVWGAASHHLGVLAAVLGRFEDAQTHLAQAEDMHGRMQAPIWRARTRVETALLQHSRRSRGAAQPRAILEQALETGRLHGSVALQRDAALALDELAHGTAGARD